MASLLNELVKVVEGCRQEIQVKEVNWISPPNKIYKLDTDVSTLCNPRQIGGGGILRDSKGASHGLLWSLKHSYKRIILELGSELFTK